MLPLEPVLNQGTDAQGLEAAFPLRKTLAAVALNPYQARGGLYALQSHSIKCFTGGLGWHGSVGLWHTWACRARAAPAPCWLQWHLSSSHGMEQAWRAGHSHPSSQLLLGDTPQAGVPKGCWDSQGQSCKAGRPDSLRMLPEEAAGAHLSPTLFTGVPTDACSESRWTLTSNIKM